MASKKSNYSFERGWNKIPIGKAREVKDKILSVIGSKYNTVFYRKMKIWKNIPENSFREINKIFEEYGVNPEEVWTITDLSN